eukprot:CAMPEP_0172494698 /NCGR_PEP_ID=MMETSP1066-20121228/54017_1 /TAXON_ID=671091 /ORGANISM="Coscinodiscus wailesii, Strain CCMP2513" /LENGTH=36 /DNA_ID= /DNA_START= /DNA_END= /DNA_ORIENTATION=
MTARRYGDDNDLIQLNHARRNDLIQRGEYDDDMKTR